MRRFIVELSNVFDPATICEEENLYGRVQALMSLAHLQLDAVVDDAATDDDEE